MKLGAAAKTGADSVVSGEKSTLQGPLLRDKRPHSTSSQTVCTDLRAPLGRGMTCEATACWTASGPAATNGGCQNCWAARMFQGQVLCLYPPDFVRLIQTRSAEQTRKWDQR
eukprot:CAMPEP_0204262916 /NCGR_PEP_ID=MMETSP0468-20130131/7991_1 /ASSEMBLY_ACC=CAM_ASM_000383 /TAXON_ID=2969 /ORGANISM="Oxyrrhis marina" /LENGTH=111 /DNA_ID=CAMNT_0051237623 /DNA_START=35 /DNA_END=370 /DNA_ORIENTATION=-